MDIDAVLCNHAEAVNNQLYLVGGGIDQALVPPNAPPPYGSNMGLGLVVTVPWTATNHEHKLTVDLLHEDGQAVKVPTGPDTEGPFQIEMAFNVGRPPMLLAGDEQHIALAVNMPGLPLPSLGKYIFRISVDGTPIKNLSYRLSLQPGGQMPTGPLGPYR